MGMDVRSLARRYVALIAAFGLGASLAQAALSATYTFTKIVDTAGGFGTPSNAAINNSGTVVFMASDVNGPGIFQGSGDVVSPIASTGTRFHSGHFGAPSINDAGLIAFRAAEIVEGSAVRGVFTFSGGSIDRVHSDPRIGFVVHINDSQQIVVEDSSGVGVLTPGASRVSILSGPALSGGTYGTINGSGLVAFESPNLPGFGNGVFVRGDGTTVRIASTGGSFSQFSTPPAINDAGSVVFRAQLSSGGSGIFVGNGERLRPSIADPSGIFSDFGSSPAINNLGVVAYEALTGGPDTRILTGGTLASEVLKTGDALFGSTVVSFNIGIESINDRGQVAFSYRLSNGTSGIARADPVTIPGDAPWDPLLPSVTDGSTFVFFPERIVPRAWYDPPASNGYEYQIFGGDFLEIMGPPGYFNLSVLVDGVIVESDLDPGESFFFDSGVTKFAIIGIDPPVDGGDPTAFPTFLDFSGTPSEIRMTALPVPEPAAFLQMAVGLAFVVFMVRRRNLIRLPTS